MLVGERMTPRPITVNEETSLPEALELMRKEKIRRLPVLDKHGKLVGIVTELDLLRASPSPATTLSMYEIPYLLSKVKMRDIMTREVITVTEDTPIEEAARIMADNKIGGLPVMRDDKLVGIITETDIFKLMLELFGRPPEWHPRYPPGARREGGPGPGDRQDRRNGRQHSLPGHCDGRRPVHQHDHPPGGGCPRRGTGRSAERSGRRHPGHPFPHLHPARLPGVTDPTGPLAAPGRSAGGLSGSTRWTSRTSAGGGGALWTAPTPWKTGPISGLPCGPGWNCPTT